MEAEPCELTDSEQAIVKMFKPDLNVNILTKQELTKPVNENKQSVQNRLSPNDQSNDKESGESSKVPSRRSSHENNSWDTNTISKGPKSNQKSGTSVITIAKSSKGRVSKNGNSIEIVDLIDNEITPETASNDAVTDNENPPPETDSNGSISYDSDKQTSEAGGLRISMVTSLENSGVLFVEAPSGPMSPVVVMTNPLESDKDETNDSLVTESGSRASVSSTSQSASNISSLDELSEVITGDKTVTVDEVKDSAESGSSIASLSLSENISNKSTNKEPNKRKVIIF